MEAIDFENEPMEGVFALIYGESGSGKTHLVATLGALGKVLIVDSDKGRRTVQRATELKQFWPNIEIISFDKFADLEALRRLCEANDPAQWSKAIGKPIDAKFDWVVIDTWTEIQWIMMQKLRSEQGLGGSDKEKLEYRKNIQIQHWGMMTDLNKLSVEAFKDISKKGLNIVFTMQEAIVQDEITKSVVKGPAIHGKLVKELPAYFEVVVHTYNDIQGNWCATTLPKQGWPAKTRLGKGAEYKNPTAAQIFGAT